mmetsp:Transcript_75210/g.141923  ORF Transcript_75210/g.141923 Transcript_75210/m.141923 type:complete len:329 (-) Transcript_75210:74-1060(-)
MSEANASSSAQGRRYVYDSPAWPMYAMAWCPEHDTRFRLATASFLETDNNRVALVELDEQTNAFKCVSEVEHPFPATKLAWRPPDSSSSPLLATTSITLNLFKLEEGKLSPLLKLANQRAKSGSQVAPLTSLDWSTTCSHKIGATSVDTTCTIWNLQKQKIETQLIAHDKPVYDMAFSPTDFLFSSVSADGSIRLFDQRNLEQSTIMYEGPSPLLRLAWNKLNGNLIAAVAMDTAGVVVIDIRRPSVALSGMANQRSCVNSITWAPHSPHYLLCGTEEGLGCIWDVKDASGSVLNYECDSEVAQVQWPSCAPNYVALGMEKKIEILTV